MSPFRFPDWVETNRSDVRWMVTKGKGKGGHKHVTEGKEEE
jgi:hypothetical protein